jgi:formylmethanofuran dehydrogenase subunit E
MVVPEIPRDIEGVPVPDEVVRAAEFHTHLGPFLVVGLRMGRVITRALGHEPFTVHIRAHTGRKPPYSCTADGLQCSTPCTVGNGGLEVSDERTMTAEAERDGRRVVVRLRRDVFESIERDCTEENQERYAMTLWDAPDEELFEIEEAA